MIAQTAFRSDECFTQKQFRRWVDQRPRSDLNRYELIDGRIVMTPPAGRTHARIEIKLAQLINEYVENEDIGIALGSSAGYDLPSADTVEPDVSYVSSERLAAGPHTGPDQFLRVVPNLVVEILSPSTAKRDQTEKKTIYERNGVDEYWIVNPRRGSITVFHLHAGTYDAGQAFSRGTLRSRVLPGLRIPIEKLFAS